MYSRKCYFFLFLTITLSTSIFTKTISNDNDSAEKETWINVFFHGAVSISPALSLETINKVKQDDLENTFYLEYVKNVRQNKFFSQNEPKQEVGLIPVDTKKINIQNSAYAISKLFDLQFLDTINYYYTFGWSGLMSDKARSNDAKNFYLEFSKEIKKFHNNGIFPKVRLIGFSLGGPTCLSIAKIIKTEKLPILFYIDELILIATPIFEEALTLVSEPIFKKIYNFYSGSDRVQVLDFSQKNRHFSKQLFESTKDFKIKDNLLQIKLEILRPIKNKNGKIILSPKWKPMLPRHSVGIRKSSPGHCEWWFLQYTSTLYRNTFALTPLPAVAFIPTIINNLNNNKIEPKKIKLFDNKVTVKIRPFEDYMEIESSRGKTKLNFLSKDKFNLFKDIVYNLNFTKITGQMYAEKVGVEIEKAKIKIKNYNKNKKREKKSKKNGYRKVFNQEK
ncbi:MAG: hypothetical protein UR12_C0041G0003 [candidate division TM6 bacterium GW2011_GWF2_30_66]|jgi:hypothetical protein|nr:MAG: hypothetical protein UR12_C0041G0003 [candidate division TM6 bacterium GW2011_GWF2_30_66]